MSFPITLIGIYSHEHLPLKKRFEGTFLDADIRLQLEEFQSEGAGDGSFRSPQWYHALRKKAQTILKWIRKLQGEILIFSDVDIQFFQPIRPVIESVFANEDWDIALQMERQGGDYNTGFVAIRCSPLTEAFYERMVAEFCPEGLGDQSWLNRHIRSSDLRHRALPREIWAFSQSPNRPPSGIILHHANCTTNPRNGVQQKLSQMDRIKAMVERLNLINQAPPL